MSINKILMISGLLLLASTTAAHEMRPALLKLTAQEDGNWQVLLKQPQVQGRFLGLKVTSNCTPGEPQVDVGETALQEVFLLSCGEAGLQQVAIPGLKNTLIDAMVTVQARDGSVTNHLMSARSPQLNLGDATPSAPVYLVLGIEHLLFGIDHVLFVLILMYLVQGWVNLLKVITSFTLAHSITLALSAFDVVSVAQAPVEAMIALSIVLLAAEYQQPHGSLIRQQPWIVAFVFGLLHGLGFAGALAEIGLPEAAAVMALFLFNVGIELGQIAVVIICLLAVGLLARLGVTAHRAIVLAPVYVIGGLASFWFIERSIAVLS